MTLSPQALYVQECILKAVHHTDDIEEAREKEKLLQWCIINFWRTYQNIVNPITDIYENYNTEKTDIIWLPPSLDRILYTLWSEYIYYDSDICKVDERCQYDNDCDCWARHYGISIVKILRNLLNEDWTSCTLFDQSKLTINIIATILWYKDELKW